jgi:hypothetical protein
MTSHSKHFAYLVAYERSDSEMSRRVRVLEKGQYLKKDADDDWWAFKDLYDTLAGEVAHLLGKRSGRGNIT